MMNKQKGSLQMEAAEWFATIQEPELSGEQLLAWEEWISSSPENLQAFSRYQDLYKRMARLEEIPLPNKSEMVADDYDGGEPISEWLAKQSPSKANVVTYPVRKRRSIWLPMAAAAAIVMAVFVFVSTPEGVHTPEVQVYETAVAQQREITLDDGSQITLGAKSGVSVSYAEHRRNIVLTHGEAFFRVTGDTERPFFVIAGKGGVTVLGTAFNVNRNAVRTEVTVTEGRVQVVGYRSGEGAGTSASESIVVEAGEQVSYTSDGELGSVSQVELDVTDWQKGFRRYRRELLQEVMEDINRYSPRSIILVGRNTEKLMFTGTVYADQIDEWLSGVIDIYGLEVSEAGDKAIILRKR